MGQPHRKDGGFTSTDSYDKSPMHAWSWSEIVGHFGPML